MSFALLALTGAVMYGVHNSATPPVVVKNDEKTFSAENPYFLYMCLRITNIASTTLSLIEMLLLATSSLAIHFPQSAHIATVHQRLCTALMMPSGHVISASPIRILAGLAIVAGSLIRWWCYREMGRHFTFRITVLKSHSLVTTGPYSFVRHPSYLGGSLLLIAIPFWYGSQGGWLSESELGRGYMIAAWYAITSTFIAVAAQIGWVYRIRVVREDDLMRSNFGEAWEAWAEKVPHRIIPGIF